MTTRKTGTSGTGKKRKGYDLREISKVIGKPSVKLTIEDVIKGFKILEEKDEQGGTV
jgi:hypothetical protein